MLQTRARSARVLLTTTLLVSLLGCGGAEAPADPAVERLESAVLDLALAVVPAGFSVGDNGDPLVLVRADDDGTIHVTADVPTDFGIDVVQVANDQKSDYEGRPGGIFSGAQKLVSPLGQATYARGRWDTEDGTVEETRVFALHPTANRLLTLTYRYPAGDDSAERVAQLLEVLGELETLAEATPAVP